VARLARGGTEIIIAVPTLDWRRVRPHPLRWLRDPLDWRLAPYSALGDYLAPGSKLR
jgi:hypothetical protein